MAAAATTHLQLAEAAACQFRGPQLASKVAQGRAQSVTTQLTCRQQHQHKHQLAAATLLHLLLAVAERTALLITAVELQASTLCLYALHLNLEVSMGSTTPHAPGTRSWDNT